MWNITLRRLEVFLSVVETGSFAAAAERLNVAQPSVSAHIKALENHIGAPVFIRRRGSRPVLTELGRSVGEHARQLLADAGHMRADVVRFRTTRATQLILSCQRSLANFALKGQLTQFALSRPDIQLTVRIGKQEDVIDDVRLGVADIGCFLSNDFIRGMNSEVVGAQRLFIAAAPSHPLAGQRRVKPAEVAKCGFVAPPPNSLFGQAVAKLLASVGITDINVVAQATEYQFLRELVSAGVGICCSPAKSIESDVKAGMLCTLDLDAPDLQFNIQLMTSQHRPRSGPMDEFTVFLKACMPHI